MQSTYKTGNWKKIFWRGKVPDNSSWKWRIYIRYPKYPKLIFLGGQETFPRSCWVLLDLHLVIIFIKFVLSSVIKGINSLSFYVIVINHVLTDGEIVTLLIFIFRGTLNYLFFYRLALLWFSGFICLWESFQRWMNGIAIISSILILLGSCQGWMVTF